MTTPFLRVCEAFDAHPGDHELARLVDAIGERRAPSGVGTSDKSTVARKPCIRCGKTNSNCWGDERSGSCETLSCAWASPQIDGVWRYQNLADCQDEHPRGGITHAPDSPLLRQPTAGELAMSIAEAKLKPLRMAVDCARPQDDFGRRLAAPIEEDGE